MASAGTFPQIGTHDKSVPWYTAELQHIEDPAHKIFKKYFKILSDEVLPHIHQVCRENRPGMSGCTLASILQRIKDGQTLLDLGCCFTQDIRKLVFNGAPSENIWGADLRSNFIGLGYKLFLDQETLKTTFLTADIMDPESALKQLHGQVDIVYAGSFFHLFGWDDQLKVAKRVVQLLKPRKGSLVLGRQVGNVKAGEYR